ncbi:hypothetical protein C7271_10635 [filamentous cyanobacterium CCP5]|nr:hypothetical protein C7271_10635 [filamentous cyanobacterium CCP5]
MAFVSVTRLHLRSWIYLPQFILYSNRALRQAKEAPGNLSAQVQKTDGLAFWTLTVWKHNKAMGQYMRSGAHKQAMPKLANWCDEAATVHWTQDSPEPPTWSEAATKLKADGHLVSVNHPAPSYETGEIRVS